MKTIFVLLVGFMGTIMLGALLEVRDASQSFADAQLVPLCLGSALGWQ